MAACVSVFAKSSIVGTYGLLHVKVYVWCTREEVGCCSHTCIYSSMFSAPVNKLVVAHIHVHASCCMIGAPVKKCCVIIHANVSIVLLRTYHLPECPPCQWRKHSGKC